MYEKLHGVRVITFCIMSNHFHILLEVPKPPEQLPSNAALIALIRETQGDAVADRLAQWFKMWTEQNNPDAIERERERWFGQMWNLSQFMKVLKQRFSQWFNGWRTICLSFYKNGCIYVQINNSVECADRDFWLLVM